jgi:hypothetical protein
VLFWEGFGLHSRRQNEPLERHERHGDGECVDRLNASTHHSRPQHVRSLYKHWQRISSKLFVLARAAPTESWPQLLRGVSLYILHQPRPSQTCIAIN